MDDGSQRIRCTALEHGGGESLRVSRQDSDILINTPSIFTRLRFTRKQATELRDTLSALLAESGASPGDRR